MESYDGWTPALMEDLNRASAPYANLSDEMWRRERLYRYLYWLKHRENPPFNLIRSWTDPDILVETKLWQRITETCFTDEDAEAALKVMLQDKFGLTWSEALANGTSLELAANGLPIWNAATGSLLPQSFGSCKIVSAVDHDLTAPGSDVGYSYRNPDAPEMLDLFIYTAGLNGILSGLSDHRLIDEIQRAWVGIKESLRLNNQSLGDITPPQVEPISSPSGATTELLSGAYSYATEDGRAFYSCISLVGFRGHFAKMRYTVLVEYAQTGEGQAGLNLLNADQAEFISLYGP